ncbi:MAG TPA: hypothetical protein VGF79_16150 [Bacteroidia bacterium]
MGHYLYQIAFVTLIFVINGCKPDDNNVNPHSPITYTFSLDSARAYIWADAGSYWVYKQSQTGDIDTQRVTSASTYWRTRKGTMDYSKHITVNYEKYERTLYSDFFNYKIYDKTLSPTPDGTSFNGQYRVIIERVIASEGINAPFFHPCIKNHYCKNSSAETRCANGDTVVVVQGKAYEHVAVFEVDVDEQWEEKFNCIRPKVKYYWAKGVGLIRKEMITCGYSWDLVDYKLY